MVLQFADDLDVFAFFPEHSSDSMNVGRFADKGGKDHVDSVLYAKLQVLDVFF